MKANLILNIGRCKFDDKTTLIPTEDIVKEVEKMFDVIEWREEIGQYNGDEPTIVLACFTPINYIVNRVISSLCTSLYQDAIAYKLKGKGDMAFLPNTKIEKMEFNEKFFINI